MFSYAVLFLASVLERDDRALQARVVAQGFQGDGLEAADVVLCPQLAANGNAISAGSMAMLGR